LITVIAISLGFSAATLRAQQVDLSLGFGTARADSNGQSINTFGDGTLYSTPSLGGVFTDFGASVFFTRQLGVGFTGSWRSTHDYAGLLYRPSFYTFDTVFQPIRLRAKQAAPEFRAGIGFASVHFDYDDPLACDQVPGCPSSHYFLGHAGFAMRFYPVGHFFLRPAVDVRYVNHFHVFGSNWVPHYSITFGYSFGKE
jgi:hypothetical protein